MNEVQDFLNRPLLTLNGFQITIGIVLLAASIYFVIYKVKK